jgi:hypothetical protein
MLGLAPGAHAERQPQISKVGGSRQRRRSSDSYRNTFLEKRICARFEISSVLDEGRIEIAGERKNAFSKPFADKSLKLLRALQGNVWKSLEKIWGGFRLSAISRA